jgi:hypothetical protein
VFVVDQPDGVLDQREDEFGADVGHGATGAPARACARTACGGRRGGAIAARRVAPAGLRLWSRRRHARRALTRRQVEPSLEYAWEFIDLLSPAAELDLDRATELVARAAFPCDTGRGRPEDPLHTDVGRPQAA